MESYGIGTGVLAGLLSHGLDHSTLEGVCVGELGLLHEVKVLWKGLVFAPFAADICSNSHLDCCGN